MRGSDGVGDGDGGGGGLGEGFGDGEGFGVGEAGGTYDGCGIGEGGGGAGAGEDTPPLGCCWNFEKSGAVKLTTGMFAVAADMKSCQISAGIEPPNTLGTPSTFVSDLFCQPARIESTRDRRW